MAELLAVLAYPLIGTPLPALLCWAGAAEIGLALWRWG